MQLNLSTMLLLFLLGAGVAMLEIAFQFMQQRGQIFGWCRDILIKIIEKSMNIRPVNPCGYWTIAKASRYRYFRLLRYLAKPLGFCPYCNGTWLSIIVFILTFGFYWQIFIFIGIVFFFIRLLIQFRFNEYYHEKG